MDGRDRLLLLTLAAFLGGLLPLAPLPTALGLLAASGLLAAARAMRRRDIALALGLVVLSTGRTWIAQHEARAAYERARSVASPPTDCSFEGAVLGSPQGAGELERFVVAVDTGRCGAAELEPGTRIALSAPTRGARRGDRVRGAARLAPPYLFENPGQIPGWVRIARAGTALGGRAHEIAILARGSGPAAWIDRFRAHVRARIVASYHPGAAALGRALVLGESDLDPDVAETFRETGLSHILAVSGTHLVVAVLGVAELVRRLLLLLPLARRLDVGRLSSLLAVPLAWLYADFAGGSGSVVRAAAMLSALLLARVVARKPDPTRAFALALALGLLLDPVVAADVSFALSSAATWGLMALKSPLGRLLGAEARPDHGIVRRAWSKLADPCATTLGATLACAPISTLLSGRVSLVGVVANVFAAPLGETLALPFALAHALLAPIPALERGAARVASGALRGVLAIARLAESLPLTVRLPPPTGWHLALLIVGAIWIMSRRRRFAAGLLRVTLLGLALIACELGVQRGAKPRGVVRVTALDVGQGDAILIDLPDGSAMLIDAGGLPGQTFDVGARVVAPALAARRRRRLDFVVLTHPHPDHYGGLAGTLASVDEVGEIWENGAAGTPPRGEIGAAIALGQAKGARLVRPAELCGAPREVGGATIEVLAPCPALDPSLEANDGSFVIRVRYGRRAALLVGDAEREAELRLLDSGADLRADLLKVGHHGSRTSSSEELIAAVRPTRALISCGVRNRFGHPHPETLQTLVAAGIEVARTDKGGAQTWTTDGEEVW